MHARFEGVVAVDGPSGSGKSTVSRRVAQLLQAHYLDTGAMYRAVTAAVLRAHVDPSDAVAVAAIAESISLEITTDPAAPTISVDGLRVDTEIRGAAVTAAVSAVAAVPSVRKLLVAQQRSIINDAVVGNEERRGVVVEGRDIGTVVAPDAIVKVYLTASESARAQRRHAEQVTGEASAELTRQDLARRDELDSSRAVDPLALAADAKVVDSTQMSIDEVTEHVLGLVRSTVERA